MLDQMCWAEEFLVALHDMDKRKILLIYVVFPDESEGSSKSSFTTMDQPRKRIYPLISRLDMDEWIDQEWRAEAGNMLVAGMCLFSVPLFYLN